MENTGWIKLHRSIRKWEWWSDIDTRLVFIELLLLANHEDKKWQGITIECGSLITSREKLAKSIGISIRSVRTALTHLKTTSEVTIKTTNKYTYISINNYKQYQQNDQQDDKRTTSNRPATDHKQEYKNDKNEKEIKNTYTHIENITEKDIYDVSAQYSVPTAYVKQKVQAIDEYCRSTGKKYKDYKATLQTWIRGDLEKGKVKKTVQSTYKDNLPELLKEQTQRNLLRVSKMKEQLLGNYS